MGVGGPRKKRLQSLFPWWSQNSGSQLPATRDGEDWPALGCIFSVPTYLESLPTPSLSPGCMAQPCAPLPPCPPGPRPQAVSVMLAPICAGPLWASPHVVSS